MKLLVLLFLVNSPPDFPQVRGLSDAIYWTNAMILDGTDFRDSLRTFAAALPREGEILIYDEEGESSSLVIRYDWIRHEIEKAVREWPNNRQPLESLAAYSSHLPRVDHDVVAPSDTTEYRRVAAEILSRREFRREEKKNFIGEWLGEKLREFFRWLSELFPEPTVPDVRVPAQMTGAGTAIYYIILVVGGLFLLFVIYQVIRKYRRREKDEVSSEPEIPFLEPGEPTEPDEQWALAQTEAAHGNYRRAIRHVLLSIILHLDKNDWVRYRRDFTNFEYADWIRQAEKLVSGNEASSQFKMLAGVFDRVWYGMKEAGPTEYESAAEARRSILEAAKVRE